MILKLHSSKLFTMDTAVRFSRRYKVPMRVWHEIWKRYLSGYDLKSLAGYFLYETNIRISTGAMEDWLKKTEIYCKANHIMLMGVRVVRSEYFGDHEPFVLKEILRHMQSGETHDSRTIV